MASTRYQTNGWSAARRFGMLSETCTSAPSRKDPLQLGEIAVARDIVQHDRAPAAVDDLAREPHTAARVLEHRERVRPGHRFAIVEAEAHQIGRRRVRG